MVSAVSIIQSLMCWCALHFLCHGHTVSHIHLCSEVNRPGRLATVPDLSDSQEAPEVWQMPFCENILMKATALPGNGPSSSWATSLIFSRMMEPWDIMEHIIVCCYRKSWKEMRVTKFERNVSRIFVEKNWHLSTGRTGPWKFIFTELSSFAILMLARKSSATWLHSNGEYWPLTCQYLSPPDRRSRSRRRGTAGPRQSTGPRGKTDVGAGRSGKMSTPDPQLDWILLHAINNILYTLSLI